MTIAIIGSLVTIGVALIPPTIRTINLRSQTTAFFLGTTPHDGRSALVVRLTNVGGRPAQVVSAHVEFGTAGIEGTELDILERGAMVVPAGGTSDLKLYAETLRIPGLPATIQEAEANPRKTALAQRLCATDVKLFITLQERGLMGGLQKSPRTLDLITVLRPSALKWVMERATGADPNEDCS